MIFYLWRKMALSKMIADQMKNVFLVLCETNELTYFMHMIQVYYISMFYY